MSKAPRPPDLPIRPHTFVPDFSEPADHKGNRLCAGCSMPKDNRVHDYTPPKDNSARIIGEGEG